MGGTTYFRLSKQSRLALILMLLETELVKKSPTTECQSDIQPQLGIEPIVQPANHHSPLDLSNLQEQKSPLTRSPIPLLHSKNKYVCCVMKKRYQSAMKKRDQSAMKKRDQSAMKDKNLIV